MNITIQDKWYNVEDCANTKALYVFGDNTKRIGKGSQAQIRELNNSFGIATKNLPSMSNESFFNDSFEDIIFLVNDIKTLYQFAKFRPDLTIVFPRDGLGTGLSQLPTRAPLCNNILQSLLLKYFDIETDELGKLFLKGTECIY